MFVAFHLSMTLIYSNHSLSPPFVYLWLHQSLQTHYQQKRQNKSFIISISSYNSRMFLNLLVIWLQIPSKDNEAPSVEGVGERSRTKSQNKTCSWVDRVLLNSLVCHFWMISGILLSYIERFTVVCACECIFNSIKRMKICNFYSPAKIYFQMKSNKIFKQIIMLKAQSIDHVLNFWTLNYHNISIRPI